MLSRLWHHQLSAAVIDCHYDGETDTISACDTNGLVVIIDSDTGLRAQAHVSLPAWGIAHIYDGSGEPIIAVAEAQKASKSGRSQGALSIIDGREAVRLRVPVEGPCWDVALSNGAAWCSSWGGQLIRVPLAAEAAESAEALAAGGQAYGLAIGDTDSKPTLIACVAERGIIELDSGSVDSDVSTLPAAAAAYNLARHGRLTVAGSTRRGMLVIDGPIDGQGVRRVALSGQVSAVSLVADELLVAGDLDGSLAVFHISQLDHPLDGMTLPGGVWNLAPDGATGRIYAACGDGNVYALELSLGASLSRERIAELRDAATSRPPSAATLLRASSAPSEIAVALAEVEKAWSDYSRADIGEIATVLRRWAGDHHFGRLSYRLGVAELELGHSHDAIIALQQIDPTSDSYVPSLLPLADAFDLIDSPRTAINVLKANLDRMPSDALLDVLFKIGQLSEKCHDTDGALTAYEAVSFQDHSFPGVREALIRLHPT